MAAACGGGGEASTSPGGQQLRAVTVASEAASILVGSTLQLSASARDAEGAPIQAAISWTSSANGVASVSTTGLVTAVSGGKATITATATAGGASVSATRVIIVVAPFIPVLTSVSITAPATSLNLNATVQLLGVARDQAGGPMAAAVAWSSSATAVATVNAATGLVTAMGAGTTTITATAVIGTVTVSASQQITVSAVPLVLTTVAITASTNTVSINGTLGLLAIARDQLGNVYDAAVSWSTSDASRATVNSQGVVTGTGLGTVIITATAGSGTVSVASTHSLTVTAGFPTTATVVTTGNRFNPVGVEIAAGGTVTWIFQAFHNVTFSGGTGVPDDIDTFESGSFPRTFPTAGRFDYFCTLHFGMIGTVTVR